MKSPYPMIFIKKQPIRKNTHNTLKKTKSQQNRQKTDKKTTNSRKKQNQEIQKTLIMITKNHFRYLNIPLTGAINATFTPLSQQKFHQLPFSDILSLSTTMAPAFLTISTHSGDPF